MNRKLGQLIKAALFALPFALPGVALAQSATGTSGSTSGAATDTANPAAQDLGLRANELVTALSAAVNGRGGGKADLAQGSGKGAAGIDAALAALRAEIGRS